MKADYMSEIDEKDIATNIEEVIVLEKIEKKQSFREKLFEMLQGPLVGLWIFLILGLGVVQIIAGYLGIQDGMGTGWAVAAIIIFFMFRFTLPITVGSFFGVMNVWEWHPIIAFLIAAPGLLFMVPGLFAIIVQNIKIKPKS